MRLANGLRTARIRRGWRQADLAARSGLSRTTIARLESGQVDGATLRALRSIARALELDIRVSLRWRGAELDRLVDAAHASMHEELARRIAAADGWVAVPEVSYSIFGERGVIDSLAWHAASRTVLIIELKTLLVDVSELLGTMDRRRRLALRIGAERGWPATTVAAWVALGATSTNRRRVEAHRRLLRAAFPATGPQLRDWLRAPSGPIAALTFLSYDHQQRTTGGRMRVRPRRRAGSDQLRTG